MPKRHGLFQEEGKPVAFLYGIRRLFVHIPESFIYFVDQSDGTAKKKDASPNADELQGLRCHFDECTKRLLYSLDNLQIATSRMETFYARTAKNDPIGMFEANDAALGAGTAADAVLHYLNIFLDDIARVVPFALGLNPLKYAWFSLTNKPYTLQRFAGAEKDKQLAPVRDLFHSLGARGGWFARVNKFGEGVRPRIVHYPDLCRVQGSGNADGTEYRTTVFLMGWGSDRKNLDVVAELQAILGGMCEWLDALDETLFRALTERCAKLEKPFVPKVEPTSRVYVPLATSSERRDIPEDFLYMPICDDSPSLRRSGQWHAGEAMKAVSAGGCEVPPNSVASMKFPEQKR